VRQIEDWRPEDLEFWDRIGAKIAWRNLRWAIVSLTLSFCVWMMWSGLVVYLRDLRPDISDRGLFWLTALPLLSAAFIRVVYSFMVPIWGGRRWTLFSTAILLVPLLWLTLVLGGGDASYAALATIALLCGLGGAVFSSSQANISLFFPQKRKGVALGVLAMIGNSGVGLIQLAIPFLVALNLGLVPSQAMPSGEAVWLANVPLVLAVLLALACIGVYFRMNDLTAMRFSVREQLTVLRNKHTWLMCALYTLAFGSFIGLAAAFPMTAAAQFPEAGLAKWAFLGAALSAVARPFGNILAARVGSARMTFAVFLLMAAGLWFSLLFAPGEGHAGSPLGFLISYALLFIGTGLGIGSTTEMILDIFAAHYQRRRGDLPHEEMVRRYQRDSAASLGFTAAVATLGAFFMPPLVSYSLSRDGTMTAAVWQFTAFYAACLFIAWRWYLARSDRNPFLLRDGDAWRRLDHHNLTKPS